MTKWLGLGLILISSLSWGASITGVKGKVVLVDLEGDAVDVGDKFFLVDENNKKRALITIRKTRESQAVAQLLKGKAKAGMKLLATGKPGRKKKAATRASVRGNKSQIGGLASINMNTINTKPQSGTPTSASGTSFDLLGIFQIPVDNNFSARLFGGYQTLSVKASNGLDANISYLGLGGLIRYSLSKAKNDYWVGAGLGFLVPVSKSSTGLIDASKVSTNQTILISAGADIGLAGKAFIPITLQYALFPSTTTVTTSQIQIQAGYGISF